MTPETLRYLREQRGFTREALAEYLGDCTASTVNKWERGMHDIPAWVQDKMLRDIPVTLPVEEMLMLLTEAKASGQSAESILADACRLWIQSQREKNPSHEIGSLVKPLAWKTRLPAPTVDSTLPSPKSASSPANATIVPLPQQHVVGLNETTQSPPVSENRVETTYPKPSRKRKA